jgi:hypothetical protein
MALIILRAVDLAVAESWNSASWRTGVGAGKKKGLFEHPEAALSNV